MGSWPCNRFSAGQPVDTDVEKAADESAKQRNDQIDRKHNLVLNHMRERNLSATLLSFGAVCLLLQKPRKDEDPPFTFTSDHFYNSRAICSFVAGRIQLTLSIPEWPVCQRRTD